MECVRVVVVGGRVSAMFLLRLPYRGGSPFWIGEGGAGCGDVDYTHHTHQPTTLLYIYIKLYIYIGIIGKEHYKTKK